nr:ribbon-helix-helix protein, CopG family [[Clostridium] innocuum]
MGRPIVGKPKNVRVQILADEDTILKMDDLCKKKKISRSELIRQLIKGSK